MEKGTATMKKDRCFYPAVFTCEDGQEIAVEFPDLGVATSGTNDDAKFSARELLGASSAAWRKTVGSFPHRPRSTRCRPARARPRRSWMYTYPQ